MSEVQTDHAANMPEAVSVVYQWTNGMILIILQQGNGAQCYELLMEC